MSLSRKRRRKREQRRCHETRTAPRSAPADGLVDSDGAWPSADRLLESQRALEEFPRSASRDPSSLLRDAEGATTLVPSSRALREADEVRRLVYTRRQAAEALGVSLSTIDRRVVPAIDTVKLAWGQRLIPVDELERFLRDHLEPARGRPVRRLAGRPATLPRRLVERIRREYARGRALSEIARGLNDEGVPTAHGGRQWWPSTVRAVLVRSESARDSLSEGHL